MGKRKANQSNSAQRDDSSIATDYEVLREFITKPKPYTPVVAPPLHLPSFDARKWHPEPVRPVSEPRSASRLTLPRESAVRRSGGRSDPPERTAARALPSQLTFSQPKQVSICVRRKARREVLFAKAKTRKGAGASRRKRSQWSNIQCSTRS